eukprot:351484-Chlamydomonas_euryale.AAC.1
MRNWGSGELRTAKIRRLLMSKDTVIGEGSGLRCPNPCPDGHAGSLLDVTQLLLASAHLLRHDQHSQNLLMALLCSELGSRFAISGIIVFRAGLQSWAPGFQSLSPSLTPVQQQCVFSTAIRGCTFGAGLQVFGLWTVYFQLCGVSPILTPCNSRALCCMPEVKHCKMPVLPQPCLTTSGLPTNSSYAPPNKVGTMGLPIFSEDPAEAGQVGQQVGQASPP